MVAALVLIILGYISGSLPFGYWTGKVLKGIDIREHGSGSTGATNVYRCVGKGAGAFVFVADNLKGTLPVLLAMYFESTGSFGELGANSHLIPALVAVAALIGHSKSPFLNFSGGKSAAVGLGTLFALNPIGGLLTMITFFSMCFLTKIVSIASITAVGMCGVFFYLLQSPKEYIVYCIFGFIYVTYRHKANIKRIIDGTEPRIGQKPNRPPPPKKDNLNKNDSSALLQ
jgi:acyl phosphate:glycerol-3-phosphate acyltransferase